MRTKLLLTIGSAVLIVAVAAIVVPAARQRTQHHLKITAYFRDANGLKPGARVALAGVSVGVVESVRARPERRDSPAEVVMNLHTDYPLNIPTDAVVTLLSAGVLGETFAEIEVANAFGSPIGDGAVLKSAAPHTLSSQELLNRISEAIKTNGCRTDALGAKTSQQQTPADNQK